MKKYIRISIILLIVVLLNGCGYSNILNNTESPEVIESNDEHILNPSSYDETNNYNYVFMYKYPNTSNEKDVVNKLYLNVVKVVKTKGSIIYKLADGYVENCNGTCVLYLETEQGEYYITVTDFAIVPKCMLDSKITTDDIVDGFFSDSEEAVK